MHSRDTTFLIDLLLFNVMHYSSLFQYFFQSKMVPNLVENSKFFSALFVNFFCKHYYDWNTIQGQIQGTSKDSMDFLPVP